MEWCQHEMNKPFRTSLKRKRVLFMPKLEQLPGIEFSQRRECSIREHLEVPGLYMFFLC